MRRLARRWLGASVLVLAAGPLAAQDTLLAGTVTNLGYDGRSDGLTGTLALTATEVDESTSVLHLAIGAPLGGSGEWNGHAWTDSLLMRSISPVGDSIAWLGWREGEDRLAGVYHIYGGQYEGQGGRWEGTLHWLGRAFLAGHRGEPRPARIATADFQKAFAAFLPPPPARVGRDATSPISPEEYHRRRWSSPGPSAVDSYWRRKLADERRSPAPASALDGVSPAAGRRPFIGAGSSAHDPAPLPAPVPDDAVASLDTAGGLTPGGLAPAVPAAPGVGWLGWALGVPLALLLGWVASFGRDLRLIREDRRVLLALVFVPGLYLVLALSILLMLGVAGGVLWLLVLLAEAIHRIPVGVMFAIAVGALIGLWTVLGALWHSVRRAEVRVHAEELKRQDAPGLYAILDRLAKRLGAAVPDSVVLEMGTSFFVTEARVRTYTGTCGHRTLCVSAPLLHVLTAAEVESILAHELAHFSGADTAYSRRFYPVYRGASHALAGMAAVGEGSDSGAAALPLFLPMLLLGWYLAWFSKLEARNSREREFRADRLASEATAPLVMASALLKVHAFAPLWASIPEGIKALHTRGQAFVSAARAFGEKALETPALVEAARTGEAHQLTHPTDSHPSLADRLAALGLDRATVPLGQGAPAHELVADLPAREERLTDTLSYLVLASSGLLRNTSGSAAA